PPTFSGYPTSDRSGWDEFRREYERTHTDLWKDFDAFVTDCGADPLPPLEFIHESPFLNLYVYPEEADYERSVPLGERWHRLDSCVRATEPPFEVPERLRGRPGRPDRGHRAAAGRRRPAGPDGTDGGAPPILPRDGRGGGSHRAAGPGPMNASPPAPVRSLWLQEALAKDDETPSLLRGSV